MPLHDNAGDGLTWVGIPIEVVRTLGLAYLDDARLGFEKYVTDTLTASQRVGGRFNPPGEFGALYASSDSDTAWAEIAARYEREGVPGLPPEMGLISFVITTGQYADLTDSPTREVWEVDRSVLVGTTPDARAVCQERARAIRVRADFIQAPSAQASGSNYALFPDRLEGTLHMSLQSAQRELVPEHLRQSPKENW